jgi:hypothetical protein
MSKFLENLSSEEKQNLLGFFDLLMKIDQRVNLDEYKIEPIDKSGQKVYAQNKELIKSK